MNKKVQPCCCVAFSLARPRPARVHPRPARLMLSFASDLQDHREWARARAAARTAVVLSAEAHPEPDRQRTRRRFRRGMRSIAVTPEEVPTQQGLWRRPHQTFRHSGPFGMTDGSIHEGRFDTSNVLPLDSPTGGSLTEFFLSFANLRKPRHVRSPLSMANKRLRPMD